jgi:hypothetical protein
VKFSIRISGEVPPVSDDRLQTALENITEAVYKEFPELVRDKSNMNSPIVVVIDRGERLESS